MYPISEMRRNVLVNAPDFLYEIKLKPQLWVIAQCCVGLLESYILFYMKVKKLAFFRCILTHILRWIYLELFNKTLFDFIILIYYHFSFPFDCCIFCAFLKSDTDRNKFTCFIFKSAWRLLVFKKSLVIRHTGKLVLNYESSMCVTGKTFAEYNK